MTSTDIEQRRELTFEQRFHNGIVQMTRFDHRTIMTMRKPGNLYWSLSCFLPDPGDIVRRPYGVFEVRPELTCSLVGRLETIYVVRLADERTARLDDCA